MSSQESRVVAVTAEYEIHGCIPTDSGRIQDVLNDNRSDFIQLADVRIFAQGDRQTCLGAHQSLLLVKRNIMYGMMTSQLHEAPVKRLHYYTTKSPMRVFVAIGGARIEGSLHLSERERDPRYLLTQLNTFFPLTDASLSCRAAPAEAVPVIFVQKSFVDCFSISAEACAPTA